jgi:hypothetical protein
MLDQKSSASRDRPLGELATLASNETAASWVREALDSKNSLTAADAKQLEDAFEQRLSELSGLDETEGPPW